MVSEETIIAKNAEKCAMLSSSVYVNLVLGCLFVCLFVCLFPFVVIFSGEKRAKHKALS